MARKRHLEKEQLWYKDTNKRRFDIQFWRFYFCMDHFRKIGLSNLIDNTLGIRGKYTKYSYSEIFETMLAIYLTGMSRIEDVHRLSAQFSEKSQGYKLCSPDTILKILSDMVSEDTYVDSKDGKSYKFNINDGLNQQQQPQDMDAGVRSTMEEYGGKE